eukprot:10362681-Heterocapsa_arctica.AAC.1
MADARKVMAVVFPDGRELSIPLWAIHLNNAMCEVCFHIDRLYSHGMQSQCRRFGLLRVVVAQDRLETFEMARHNSNCRHCPFEAHH